MPELKGSGRTRDLTRSRREEDRRRRVEPSSPSALRKGGMGKAEPSEFRETEVWSPHAWSSGVQGG